MKYNPDIHHRRSIRLKEYDYSQAGAYFVTICTKDKECLLGEISDRAIKLSRAGETANNCLMEIPKHYNNVDLDIFTVMPNHVHAVIVINNVGVQYIEPLQMNAYQHITPNSIGSIIRSYKAAVTRLCAKQNISFQWQRNYYEHIIRNETELNKTREYITTNPLNWETDENFM